MDSLICILHVRSMLNNHTAVEKLTARAAQLAEDALYDDSIRAYDEALKISGGNVKILADKALTLVAADRGHEALPLYETALKSDPDNPDILVNLGAAFHSLERYADAVRAYRRAIAVCPSHAAAFSWAGSAFAEMGMDDDALNYMQKAASLDKEFEKLFQDMKSKFDKKYTKTNPRTDLAKKR